MKTGSRILVTGATGFLGSHVCRLLKAHGFICLANGRDWTKLSQLEEQGFKTIRADLATMDPVHFAEQAGDLDAIVHSAALSSPWGRMEAFESANIAATRNLLQVARILNTKRFILVSSPTVYFRFADQLDLREDEPLPRPVNYYAGTKQHAEALVAESTIGMRITLRPRGIYGKGDVALLPRLMRAAASGPLPLLRDGVAQTDITHVEDVAEAIMACLGANLSDGSHTFNISGGEPLALVRIIGEACRMNGINPNWRRLPAGLVIGAARLLEAAHSILPGYPEPKITAYSAGILAYSQTLNITKAAQQLNWAPRINFNEGLFKTFGRST